jgi:hypothetical protein
VSGSEDCLFVNVWRPADSTTGLPVLVHIHGGGFVAGSGNGDNSLLASTGHEVVVSLNYQLGIFGFLADKALGPNSGDYGLQDQQAALRWVQSNIAQFGGDPKNVMIYGESAGGSSSAGRSLEDGRGRLGHGQNGNPLGFPPSFAPRRPGADDARRGGDRPSSTDLELHAQHHISRSSNRVVHSRRATSRRTA